MISAVTARQRSLESNVSLRGALHKIDQAIRKVCEQPANNLWVDIRHNLNGLSITEIQRIEDMLREEGYTVEFRNSFEVLVKW